MCWVREGRYLFKLEQAGRRHARRQPTYCCKQIASACAARQNDITLKEKYQNNISSNYFKWTICWLFNLRRAWNSMLIKMFQEFWLMAYTLTLAYDNTLSGICDAWRVRCSPSWAIRHRGAQRSNPHSGLKLLEMTMIKFIPLNLSCC